MGVYAPIYAKAAILQAPSQDSRHSASYDDRGTQASALINAARDPGGSIGISSIANVLWHREQLHQTRIVEHPVGQCSLPPKVQQQAIGWVGQQVKAQASFLAYLDALGVMALIAREATPLVLILRKVKLGGGARGH